MKTAKQSDGRTRGNTSTPAVQQGKRRARRVGLAYVNEFDKGITRRRCGNGFVYLSPGGKILKSDSVRARIAALAIPPAWEDVWISPSPNGHIQARGRDAAGRKQYIYHDRWQVISTATKYDRMHLLAKALPRIRRRLRRDLKGKKLTRNRVLAAVVRLLDRAHVRIGNDRYARQTGSRGATTLTANQVDVQRFTISLDFPGKSGQRREVEFTDKETAKVIQQCEEIDEQFLFCYRDEDGSFCRVHSTDVNDYLRSITGESLTSKDFRTWWGSVLALAELADIRSDLTRTQRKKAVAMAVAATADALGNTRAVCRKSYIHPGILSAAEAGELPLLSKAGGTNGARSGLSVDEARFANLLPHLDSRLTESAPK